MTQQERSIEIKEKIFALYWGQEVSKHTELNGEAQKVGLDNFREAEWRYLELKPLSSITDEDAAIIAMLLVQWPDSMVKLTAKDVEVRSRRDGDHNWDIVVIEFSGTNKWCIKYRHNDFMGWRDSNGRCESTLFNHSQVTDFLRSRGYALPAFGFTVEELVQAGIFKIKEA